MSCCASKPAPAPLAHEALAARLIALRFQRQADSVQRRAEALDRLRPPRVIGGRR